MKQMKRFTALLLMICTAIAVIGCGPSKSSQGRGNSEYRVAMITDSGDITDQSFNQTTYEACLEYCTENNIDFTYKKPDGDTDYARIAMIDVAVAEGYNIIVMPGYIFAPALVEVTYKYPDVKFIALDMTAGYMAGYAAVKLGYRKLGFLGGQAVPAVMRYGFGYVQGINDAAKELGITDQIEVEYAYGGQFYGSTEVTAAMDTWYSQGTEIVFACGGGIFTSAAEAAAKVDGKMIGVDSDQSPIIDAYGEGMTVTSAMKGLGATVKAMLHSIIVDNTWEKHVGKIENLGLISGTDMSVNYVGLPEDMTQWNDGFTVENYHKLVEKIYNGDITIDNSTDQMPEVEIKVNERQGSIM